MNYTNEQKRILRQEKFDAFANGFRRGCCLPIAFFGISLFLLSFCSNKPVDYQPSMDKKPVPIKKATQNTKIEKEQHTR